MNAFKNELKAVISNNPNIDYISISGSGEPTLHKNLDTIIDVIKKITRYRYPVCVITNASLLYRKDVRRELREADVVIPSLDAALHRAFYKINKPCSGLTFERVKKGLLRFRKEFKGSIWLEIMLISGYNDSLFQARRFSAFIKKLKPEKVQLNLPVRPATFPLRLPSLRKVRAIKKIIGPQAEIIGSFRKKAPHAMIHVSEKEVINFLRRRPATLQDLKSSLGLPTRALGAIMDRLLECKKVKTRVYLGKKHFSLHD